ncbi:uncharacterized protein ISCGN_020968, partial [Ixodes scapularis]
TFQKARSKLRKAEDTDDVATSSDQDALDESDHEEGIGGASSPPFWHQSERGDYEAAGNFMVPPSSSPPDFSRLIPRELRFVKKQLKTITKKLLEREEPCEPAEEACISLPLKTDADVDEIEEKLKASQEFCLQL